VDTIGLQGRDKPSYINNFRTKHTEKLHVAERFKIDPDGKALQVNVTVTDPEAYNEPLHMALRWRQAPNQYLETVCAENNEDHFGHNLFPMPQAAKPDF
jgi:hypothetical protein